MYYMIDECEEECILPVPDKVTDGLYISGNEVAESKEALKKHKITHILNLKGGKQLFPKVFVHSDLLKELYMHIYFIENILQRKLTKV
jgi:hypothetical protein